MRIACVAAFLAAPAIAQGLTPAETEVLPLVLDVVQAEVLPGVEGLQTVLLLQNDNAEADLVIVSGDDRKPVLVARGIVFSNFMVGQSAALEVLENGSLVVTSEHIGASRSAWMERLTLAYRDDALRVAGQLYDAFDRLNLSTVVCDVNRLTGAYDLQLDGIPSSGKTDTEAPAITDWTPGLPQVCADAMEIVFDY